MLAQANVYNGDVIINNASTLAAAEAQGDKLGIVNGNVYITQTSTAVDAAKLQAVASKFITVTGSIGLRYKSQKITPYFRKYGKPMKHTKTKRFRLQN